MRVRWKLVAILIVPLAALATIAWSGIAQRTDDRAAARHAHELVALGRSLTPLAEELDREASLSAWFVAAGGAEGGPELQVQRSATDAAMAEVSADLADFDTGTSAELAKLLAPFRSGSDAVAVNRVTVDGLGPAAEGSVTVFAGQAAQLLDVNSQLAREVRDSDLSGTISAWVALSRTQLALAEQQAMVAKTLVGGWVDGLAADLDETAVRAEAEQSIFLSLGTSQAKDSFRRIAASPDAVEADKLRQSMLHAAPGTRPAVSAREWLGASGRQLDLFGDVADDLAAEVDRAAVGTAAAAARDARVYALLSVAVVAFALLTAFVVGRSITRPLARLLQAARDVADTQLPALVETLKDPKAAELAPSLVPVGRTSRDEIGDVAEAFGDLQQVAVEVAQEQATLLRKGIGDLFVNLARRNQSLLDRQIAYLDDLEASETDPEDLEHLFKLDHLATRMRRNAESLLVLAGVESPRRWGRPVPLGDVVRAAVGEIEDYGRVDVRAIDAVRVQGGAAADVAHLLSELLDNAAQFSPPGSPVDVEGRLDASGAYVVRITDQGIGMSGVQLAEVNATLAEPPLTGLTLSRSLGFVVVSRLADRHGIGVAVGPAIDGGVAVTVTLPVALLVADDGSAAAAEPDGVAAGPGAGPRTTTGWTRPADVPASVWERIGEAPGVVPTWGAQPVASLADALPELPELSAIDVPSEATGPATDEVDEPPATPARPTPDLTSGGLPRRRSSAPSPMGDPLLARPQAADAPTATAPSTAVPAVPAPAAGAVRPAFASRTSPAGASPRPAGAFGAERPAMVPMAHRPPAVATGGLPRRVAQRPDTGPGPLAGEARGATASARTPDEIRSMLSSFRNGLQRARTTATDGDLDRVTDPNQEQR